MNMETGLPVLPEGYFWRVVDRKKKNDGELEVQIIQKFMTEQKQHVWVQEGRSWRNLWLGQMSRVLETIEVEDEKLVLCKGLLQSRNVPEDTVKQYLDYGWKYSYRNYLRVYAYDYDMDDDVVDTVTVVLLLEPTEKNILETSELLFDEFRALQAKELAEKEDTLAREKLVGDYPPKVLGSVAGEFSE